MPKLGTKRTLLDNVAIVAGERKEPRPIRELVLAYHEDAKGKPILDKPMIVRSFRVVIDKKDMTVFNRDCEHLTIPAQDGWLDFSQPTHDSEVTVRDAEYDEDGKCVIVTNVSHDVQLKGFSQNRQYSGPNCRIKFSRNPSDTPNAFVPRVDLLRSGPTVGFNSGVIRMWQAQADSPDATWLDGKKPTVESEVERVKKLEAQKLEWAKQRAYGAQTAIAGITGPGEQLGGEDFGDV